MKLRKTTLNDDYIVAGNEAIQYARKHAPHISSLPEHDKQQILNEDKHLDVMRHRFLSEDESLFELYSIPSDSGHRIWKRVVKGSKQSEAGNCEELSGLMLNFLRKKNIPAESFKIVGGDHMFVVIGRDLESIEEDPSTWGENAVICDAISNRCYLAKNIKDELKCYRQDPTIEKMNVYYPYTNEDLAVEHSIDNDVNPEYQEGLGEEALAKISLIRSVLNELPTQVKDSANKELTNMEKEIKQFFKKNKNLTDNDVERAMNRFVKQGLRLLLNMDESPDAKKQVSEKLMLALISYCKQSQEDKSAFIKSLRAEKGGRHPPNVLKMLKKI